MQHQQEPCSFDPGQRIAVLLMPDEEKCQHLVRYKPGLSAEFCPFVVYSDLEAFSDPMALAAEDLHSAQRRVASLAVRAVTRNGFELPAYLTRAAAGEGEHAVVERYLRFLLRVGKRYLLWKKTTNLCHQCARTPDGCGVGEASGRDQVCQMRAPSDAGGALHARPELLPFTRQFYGAVSAYLKDRGAC